MISSAWWFTPSILLKQKGLYKTKERHLVVGEYYYSLEELIYIPFSYLTYSMLQLLCLVFDNNNAVLNHNLIF